VADHYCQQSVILTVVTQLGRTNAAVYLVTQCQLEVVLPCVQSASLKVDKSAVADSLLAAPRVGSDESSLSSPPSPADNIANTAATKFNGHVVPSAYSPEIRRFCFFFFEIMI